MVGCCAHRAQHFNDLLRLHSKVCRLAEAKPERLAHPEVARALEQEILHTLIKCLSSDSGNRVVKVKLNVAAPLSWTGLRMRWLCVLARWMCHSSVPRLSIPERTLQACCAEFLGMSPSRYHLLRRLNLARAGSQSDPDHAGGANIARSCGFAELGRFAAAYRSFFGELPSATLATGQPEMTPICRNRIARTALSGIIPRGRRSDLLGITSV
jgi:AraC-like DNA-binding protein